MQQLMFEEAGTYAWREARRTRRSPPPSRRWCGRLLVACCDLDVAVAQGRLPMPPGHAVGHEGLAEVVAVGDGVCSVRSATASSCRSRSAAGSAVHAARRDGVVRVAAADGDVRDGAARRAGRRRFHGRPGDGALCRRDAGRDARRRRPDRHRVDVGQHPRRLARRRPVPRRTRRRSIPPTGVCSWSDGSRSACMRRRRRRRSAFTSTTSTPTSNRLAVAEKLGAVVHDRREARQDR